MNMSVGTQKPIEVQDFKFITHSKIQVYENHVQCSIPNLVVAASRFGLIFAARLNEVKVIQLTSIAQSSLKDKKVPLRTQCLAGCISSLALNCDHTVLAISIFINDIKIIQFYDVTSYYKEAITLLNEVRLAYAPLQISWNPCIANVVAATLEDGSLWTCELNGTALNINGTENTVRAVSLSWSPKGKQIVIGTQENTLCQFKPDLKLVKTIIIPGLKGAIISVQWLSNYQFATVFHDKSNPDDAPRIIIVNAPKTGPVFSFQYEDIFYSSREQDINHISFLHQQAWFVNFCTVVVDLRPISAKD